MENEHNIDAVRYVQEYEFVDNVDNNVDKINVYTVEVECTSVYKVPVVAMSMHEACTKAVHELECNDIDDYPKTGEYEFQACSVRREGRG